ncbi:hypothetical protein NA56DRAFT_342339 [Hyaloscypha hepaticicola]|uniref:Uncharacterized protein n=1 Tax=Hyaloscypha hepaticicola TaxID=2082293 RepID=A0A2J6QJ86_9HELO|nr:hypothetical protein NA56DRAFT_342339 [Hyaloscypha hepaticicola]
MRFRLSGQRVFSAYSRRQGCNSCILHHKCRSPPSIPDGHYHSLTIIHILSWPLLHLYLHLLSQTQTQTRKM